MVPRWTWAAAAAALIAVLAPLTIEQGPDITPAPAQFYRSPAPSPATPPASLAKQDDSQEPRRQMRALDEVVAGGAGDAKVELRAQESFAADRKDALESKTVADAPAAPPPPKRAANRPASKPKAKERAVAGRKRSAAATPAPAATSPGEPSGFAAAALDVPSESDDVAEPEAVAFEEEGGETSDQDELMRTSGKLASQGRRENVDVRGAVGGITTAEALRAAVDADPIARLRLERNRLSLEERDQPDAATADTRRVHIIELSVRIYQLSRESSDLSAAQEDIRRYLAVPDAPQVDRVRELERELAGR